MNVLFRVVSRPITAIARQVRSGRSKQSTQSAAAAHGGSLPRVARVLLALPVVYLMIAWAGVILVDVMDYGSLRDRLLPVLTDRSMLFLAIFAEAGPTEIFQVALLAFALMFLVDIMQRYHRDPDLYPWRHYVLCGFVGLWLMILEDALNARHLMSFYVTMPLFSSTPEPRNPIRIATELIYYGGIACLMVVFYLQLVRCLQPMRYAPLVLHVAYLTYTAAAIASATRYIGDWYDRVGGQLAIWLAPHLFDLFATEGDLTYYPLGFWIMDWLIEESLELVGAAALAAAIAAYSVHLRNMSGVKINAFFQTEGRSKHSGT